jgi:hypothetical protein
MMDLSAGKGTVELEHDLKSTLYSQFSQNMRDE